MNTRKSLHFDLDYNNLKKYYSKTNPSNAYKEIKKYMIEHGFIHHQYSGYVSKYKMSNKSAYEFCVELSNNLPWLRSCVKNIHMTDIDLLNFNIRKSIDEPFKSYDPISLEKAVEIDGEYKLYRINEDVYELRDLDNNFIANTLCDTIEEALNEIEQKNEELEL